jgi:hypothetical protein
VLGALVAVASIAGEDIAVDSMFSKKYLLIKTDNIVQLPLVSFLNA